MTTNKTVTLAVFACLCAMIIGCQSFDQMVDALQPYRIDNFSDGMARVSKAGTKKYGYIDKNRKEVIPRKYDDAGDFRRGLARVCINGKYGIIDKNGDEIVPLVYDSIGDFNDGMAMICANEKWGYVHETGKVVIPPAYDDICYFYQGMAMARANGKWGYVDETGKKVVPLTYDDIDLFAFGMAKVRVGGKRGLVDKTGKELIPPIYDEVNYFFGDMTKVRLHGKHGLVDKTGNEIVSPKYDWIGKWNDSKSLMEVWSDGKCGFIDKNGKETSPLKYENRNIEVIWENILVSHIIQIHDYYSEIEKKLRTNSRQTSARFTISPPYLLIGMDSGYRYTVYIHDMDSEYRREVSIKLYSEGRDFPAQSISDVKTLIVQYDSGGDSQWYRSGTGHGSDVALISTYDAILVYFDVASKTCIGYDRVKGPELPKSTTDKTVRYPSLFDISEKIKSRVAKSK